MILGVVVLDLAAVVAAVGVVWRVRMEPRARERQAVPLVLRWGWG